MTGELPNAASAPDTVAGLELRWLDDGIAEGAAIRAAWVGGSVVDGLGNPSSDIDVFVVIESASAARDVTKRLTGHDVTIRYAARRRIDYEYWHASHVDGMLARIATEDYASESVNVLGMFDEDELSFLHGLRIGVPLRKHDAFEELRRGLSVAGLQRYLYEWRSLYLDDAFDDAVGMCLAGDYQAAALRARDALGFAVDCLLHGHGVTNRADKHRLPLLRRLVVERPALRRYFDAYWQAVTRVPETHLGCRGYVERTIALCEQLVDHSHAVWGQQSAPGWPR